MYMYHVRVRVCTCMLLLDLLCCWHVPMCCSSRQRGDELGELRDRLNVVETERDTLQQHVSTLKQQAEQRASVRPGERSSAVNHLMREYKHSSCLVLHQNAVNPHTSL